MTYKTDNWKADTLLKDYFSDHCYFTNVTNATIFDGWQVVLPDNITDYDTSTSTYYDEKGATVTIDRNHDVIKNRVRGRELWYKARIFGIETEEDTLDDLQ